MARIDENEGNECQQQDNCTGRLAKDGDDEECDRGQKDGDSEDGSCGVSPPEPHCDERSGGHPDPKLIAVFEEANGPVAYESLCTVQLKWLIAVEPDVDFGPFKNFKDAEGDIGQAS